MKRSSFCHKPDKLPGGRGNLTTIAPISPAGIGLPPSSNIRTSHVGMGRAGEPAFTGKGSMPMQFAAMDHPVSVCHQ